MLTDVSRGIEAQTPDYCLFDHTGYGGSWGQAVINEAAVLRKRLQAESARCESLKAVLAQVREIAKRPIPDGANTARHIERDLADIILLLDEVDY